MSTSAPSSTQLRALRVFLCHSSADKAAVRDLYSQLKRDGFAAWLDEQKLLPGQDWREEIPKAVRSSDAVLVCISRTSITKEGYLQKEIRNALEVAEEKPEGTIFIIPVRLDDVEVPNRLGRWHWANLFDSDGYERIIRALSIRARALGLITPLPDAGMSTSDAPAASNVQVPFSEGIHSVADAEQIRKEGQGWNWASITPQVWRGHSEASASLDKTLAIWDLQTAKQLHTLKGHSGDVYAVAVTSDGRRAISGSEDETLAIWDLQTGRRLRSLRGHSGWVSGVAVAPDGTLAVSSSHDGTLNVWDMGGGRLLRTLRSDSFSTSLTGLGVSIFRKTIKDVAFMPNGQHVVSAYGDGTVRVWDIEQEEELLILEGHSDVVQAVAVTPDGRYAVSASDDETLKLWDLETGDEVYTFEGHSSSVEGVAITSDGRQVISASIDDSVRIWDIGSGEAIATFACEGSRCCACSAFGVVISGTQVGQICVFRASPWKPMWPTFCNGVRSREDTSNRA